MAKLRVDYTLMDDNGGEMDSGSILFDNDKLTEGIEGAIVEVVYSIDSQTIDFVGSRPRKH